MKKIKTPGKRRPEAELSARNAKTTRGRLGMLGAQERRSPPPGKTKPPAKGGLKDQTSALLGSLDPDQAIHGRLMQGDLTGVAIASLFLVGGIAFQALNARPRRTVKESPSDPAPSAVPVQGWRNILKSALRGAKRGRVPAAAAGMAAYGILSLLLARRSRRDRSTHTDL